MAFADLPLDLQEDIAVVDKSVRGTLSDLRQLMMRQDWPLIQELVTRITSHPDFALLQSNDVIPNSTNLGASQDTTKDEWVSMWSYLNTNVFATLTSDMDLLSKMIGINNIAEE